MKIKNVHSVVDLITNSSTTIYTQATTGSVNTIKEIINTILKLSDSYLTADDLFTIHIEVDKSYISFDGWFAEKLANFYDNEEIEKEFARIVNECGYNNRNKKFQEYLDTIGIDIGTYFLENEDEYNYDSYLVITPKDGITAPDDLGKKLGTLFSSHESMEY